MTSNATAVRSHDKSNGDDKVVRTLRVYASGRVVPGPGRPPKNWGAIVARARAHALPADGPSDTAQVAPPKVKNPAKVAAGKARAAKAAAAKAAAAQAQVAAVLPKAKPKADKAPAKAVSKPKAKPAAKAKAKPAAKAKGGARAGSGPKPKSGDAMVVHAVRVSPSQKKKLAKLGAEWLRARIEAATVPTK